MGAEEHKGRLFSSWKEIAEYLKCDVRTCRRWELTLGLPIHRVKGPIRPRVFAYQYELDDWVKGKSGAFGTPAAGEKAEEPASSETASPGTRTRLRLFYFGVPLIAAFALVLLYLFRVAPVRGLPSDFRIEGSELVVLAENGRELWRHDTGFENLWDDKAYHDRFQTKKYRGPGPGVSLPWIIIRDIDRDLRPEVLFCVRTSDERGGGDLHCFSSRGQELWRFKGGREMWCGSRPYGSEYNIAGFSALDIDANGGLETVVISHQTPNWLAQLALLDSNGRLLGEFWNSGLIDDFVLADLRGDGQEELLTVGLNNEYGKGCLIVLDPRNISGGSPQAKAEFTCRDVKPGTELYYLLFPRTDVDSEMHPVESVAKIDVEKPNILSLEMAKSRVYFILDFGLAVRDVTLSHAFLLKHREAVLAGKVNSNIEDPHYKEALIKGVLYYDGRGWTSKPTQVMGARR